MGKHVVVVGTQWGDEGKGKIVDLLTQDAQVVVRYQGGHNAGHTLKINGGITNQNLISRVRFILRVKYKKLLIGMAMMRVIY